MKNPILFILLCIFSIFIYACSATQTVSKTNTNNQEKAETAKDKAIETTATTENAAKETVEKVEDKAVEMVVKTEEKVVGATTEKAETELVDVKNEVAAKTATPSTPRIGTEEAYAKITATYPDMNHAQELDKFLTVLKTSVEAHKWGPVFGQCSPMHYKTQIVKTRISPSQYLAEILGLHSEGNNIKEGKKLGYEDLKRIKTISYDKIDFDGKMITVKGNTSLQDDTQLNINLLIEIIDNQYHLTGALG